MCKKIIIVGFGRGRDYFNFNQSNPFDFKGYNLDEYEIIGIEPLEFKHHWEIIKEQVPIKIINKMAWVADGKRKFSIHPQDGKSTTIREKSDYDDRRAVEVECFDFGKWLMQYKDCEIVLEMDGEGSEVDILEDLIRSGRINLIDKLYIEFHEDKIERGYVERTQKVRDSLNRRGIDWEEE